MADKVKKEIKFNRSMTSDKRNEDFAYLRKRLLPSKTAGLYPAVDYSETTGSQLPLHYDDIIDILGSDQLENGTQQYIKIITGYLDSPRFFYTNGSESNFGWAAGVKYKAGAYGRDGLYVVGDDSKVYRIESSNTNITELTASAISGLNSTNIGGFDGLDYYWASSSGIWRHSPSSTPTKILTSLGVTPLKVAFYDDQMIIVYQSGKDLGIVFWDKKDSTLFTKRIVIKNCRYLAMGVIEDSLILVRAVTNRSNPKEYEGEMVIARYNGQNFETLNTIITGNYNITIGTSYAGTTCDTGSEVMVFSVSSNSRTGKQEDLGQNYIYKVRKDGSIEVETLPIPTNNSLNFASVVRIFTDRIYYGIKGVRDEIPPKVYSNADFNYSYGNYSNYSESEYITPFLSHPYNYHKMEGLSIAFEKMFKDADIAGQPPYLSINSLSFENILPTAFTVTWTEATDNNTPQSSLEYSVYYSTSNNINTVSNTLANGTLAIDWTTDISSGVVDTGLAYSTTYYVNVLVRDIGGNISCYNSSSVTTAPNYSYTAWTSPTADGEVIVSGSTMTKWTNPANAYSEDGSTATSNSSLIYSSYYGFGTSLVPAAATIQGVQVRIVAKSDGGYSNPPNYPIYVSLSKVINQTGGKTTFVSGSTLSKTLNTNLQEYILGAYNYKGSLTLTAAEVNSDFGLIVQGAASSSPITTNYYLDNIQVRVFYS